MFDSLYIGLSGLSTFSKGLNNISNNVANLNTVGYKGKQLLFKDLYNSNQETADGQSDAHISYGGGVEVGNSFVLFNKQGDLKQSGNALDASIEGDGFFILRKDGKTYYTRDGQFEFDKDGFLISRATQARVAVLGNNNALSDLNITDKRISAPQVTTAIKLTGDLSKVDTDGVVTLSDIPVFDSNGFNQKLKLVFTRKTNDVTSWDISVMDAMGNSITTGILKFQGDGSPQTGYENFVINYTPLGAKAQTLTINFGTPGQINGGVTNFSSTTTATLTITKSDGYAVGAITSINYDTDGMVGISYSNGQKLKLDKLALGWFYNLQALEQEGSNLYINNSDEPPIIGTAQSSLFGKITGGSIEASNVDLTQQFSELIVTQRGYQASSQVVTATNEMIQQLLDLRGRK